MENVINNLPLHGKSLPCDGIEPGSYLTEMNGIRLRQARAIQQSVVFAIGMIAGAAICSAIFILTHI